MISHNHSHECFRYSTQGQRLSKHSDHIARSTAPQVRYQPNLELRRKHHTIKYTDALRIIILPSVRLLRCPEQTQICYSLTDHHESSTLELDQYAAILSDEAYYPFGGSSFWTAHCKRQADNKIRRFSGKERDISGLIYFGQRYYAPWLRRWLNSDPAGTVDGLNLFRMVRNNPLTLSDPDGCMPNEAHKQPDASTKPCSSSSTTHVPVAESPAVSGASSSAPASVAGPSGSAHTSVVSGIQLQLQDNILLWAEHGEFYAAGREAAIFKLPNGELLKKYIHPDIWDMKDEASKKVRLLLLYTYRDFTLPELANKISSEVEKFNIVYGEGSARVVPPDALVMPNLGVPVTNDLLPQLPEKSLKSLFSELKRLHSRGILHNDMKEDNFVYDAEKQKLHLIDFSLALHHGNEPLNLSSYKKTSNFCDQYNYNFHSMKNECEQFWRDAFVKYWPKGRKKMNS